MPLTKRARLERIKRALDRRAGRLVIKRRPLPKIPSLEEIKVMVDKSAKIVEANLKTEIKNIKPETKTETIIKPEIRTEIVREIIKELDITELDKLEEEIQALRGMFLNLLNRGGGSINRQININSSVASTRYTDINLLGAGITKADNNTTKQVDITIPDSAASVGGTITGGTAGSVLFINPTGVLAQDNATFFWDVANKRLGLGTTVPTGGLHIKSDTDPALKIEKTTGTNSALAILANTGGNAYFGREASVGGTTLTGSTAYAQIIGSDAARPIQFFTNNAVNMTILSGGNVGIGVTNPSQSLTLNSTGASAWDNGSGTADVLLYRDGAAVLALRNGTTGQEFRIYRTFTDASNNEYLTARFNSSAYLISSVGNGSGSQRNLAFGASGSTAQDLVVMTSGNISIANLVSNYKNIATAGWGIPAIYGSGRSTGQTGAVASVATYTVGAADGSFLISANANITAFVAGTMNVTVSYTDETNTAQTLKLNFASVTGTLGVALAAAGPYEGIPNHIRAKASTAITVATSGTFTSLTYNVEAIIQQIM